jgi:hypothetical protein
MPLVHFNSNHVTLLFFFVAVVTHQKAILQRISSLFSSGNHMDVRETKKFIPTKRMSTFNGARTVDTTPGIKDRQLPFSLAFVPAFYCNMQLTYKPQ